MIKELLYAITPENHPVIWMVVTCALGFLVAYNAYPSVLFVAREKHLMDEPESRSAHKERTPTLGGIGIFISIMVVLTLVGAFLNTKVLLLVMGSITILFFIGLKDDLAGTSPGKKLFGQLLAATLLLVFTNTRIVGFSGILEVSVLPYGLSLVFTLFVYIIIVNAYNLIDGIDGLAGSIACLVSMVYGILFLMANQLSLAILAMALVGSILAFLRCNFSKKHKIFMGDTGSMVVGFLLAFFTVSFINIVQTAPSSPYYKDAPVVAIALLFYPLLDTLRVFALRVFKYKVSPFKADRNHIHHHIINLGYSHLQATIWIVAINALIIVITFKLLPLNLNTQILCLVGYGALLYGLPFVIKAKAKTSLPEDSY
ncbi:glycosyltransferase family 4 protein [Mangrovimonas cancribranchiae]|uniref:MraY family glycosyltransferase n=1 Tax=Mangrovimonas cancribranchiae TaxID=3080055 RepID=A0AAU6P3G2_9FLAO